MHSSYKKYVFILYVCGLMVCCASYQSHVEKLTTDLYEEEPSTDISDSSQLLLTPDAHEPSPLPATDQIATPGKLERFNVYWDKLLTRLANYWWILLLSTFLPLYMFWRVESSIGKKTPAWKNPYAQSQRQNPKNRRPTLPDLTLAKHARRELDQQRIRSPILRRKKSTANATSQMNDTRKGSFERNDDSQSDNKRVHLIRRY